MAFAFVVSLAMLAPAGACLAALGGEPAQSMPDGASVAAMAAVPAGAATYVQRETRFPSGTIVREYISNRGIVFGVTWEGPMLPDLKNLLGKHFGAMVAEAAKRPKAGHSRLRVDHRDVLILSGGRMRWFEGSAWIPAELPVGFSIADVR